MAQRGADPGHPVRCFKVPLVRPQRTPGSALPTCAAPEPISLPIARRTSPQRHVRMPRAHGACGARTLWHCWVLDFNNFIARVQDKVAAAECRRAFLKCEIDQKLRPQSAGGHFLSAGSDSARGLPPRP